MNARDIMMTGFIKTAIDMKTLRRVSSKIKNLIRARFHSPNPMTMPLLAGKRSPIPRGSIVNPGATIATSAKETRKMLAALPESMREMAMKSVPNYKHLKSGDIVISGDILKSKALAQMIGEVPKLNPSQREIANRVVRLHEKFERQALKELSGKGLLNAEMMSGHLSPSVLLREHNLIQTLPTGQREAVRKLFETIRTVEGSKPALKIVLPGFDLLGKGQKRLSRHAVKRMNESIAKGREAALKKIMQKLEEDMAKFKDM
jgi:hypothetical protein